MITGGSRPIVVGVDGSDEAGEATRWAAREAERRGASLQLVEAVPWKGFRAIGPSLAFEQYDGREFALRAAREHAEGAAAEACRTVPHERVTYDVRSGTAIDVLRAGSEHADLLVVGGRGRGGFAGLMAGSTAVSVAARSRCPVIVARGSVADGDAPIVVGVDGSDEGEVALEFAFEQASSRDVPLVAVHAWSDEVFDPAAAALLRPEDIERNESAFLQSVLAVWQRKYPRVAVRSRLVLDRPAAALVAESSDAQLVVVGSRGHGETVGMLLGSVSRAVVHHSHCPVAVVPRRGARNDDP